MKKLITNAYAIFFIVGFLLIVAAFECADMRVEDHTRTSNQEQIEPVKVVQVDDDTREYYFKMDADTDRRDCIAFFSTHFNVKVYEDGKMVYSLKGDDTIWGKSPGSRWNFVEVMPETSEIKVVLEAVYPKVRNINVVFFRGSDMEICLEVMRGSVVEIVVSILDFAIGVILISYWIVVSRRMSIGRSQFYLGFFAITMGLWSLHETEIMTILIENRVAASYGGYMLIMLMTIPFVLFIREILEMKEERFADIICIASYLGMLGCTFLHMSGIYGFKESAKYTHALDCVALLYAVWALTCWIRKNGMDRVARVNLLGALILSASFFVDIIAFYIGARKTDVFGRFGFLLYIALLGWQVSSDAVFRINEGRKAAIYKELAEKDILTKVYNRNAYNEWAYNYPKPIGTALVMFDLNNLKKCNDTLGHAAGDQYIQKAAELISQTFDRENTCYRIGGDEFCVVVPNAKAEWIEKKFEELEKREQEYNAASGPVQVHIAHGYAIFDAGVDSDIEETRSRADVEMYENKKAIKAN